MKSITQLLHSLFIPSSRNNYRARVLHHHALTAYLVVIFFMLFASVQSQGRVLGIATDITVERLLEYTNNERAGHALTPLVLNGRLSQAAQAKAQDMLLNNYWAHFGPTGATPWDFIIKSGYQYEFAGENLAKNFLYSQNVVTAWMNSPSHRENILRPEFREVGFAVVNGALSGEQTTLVVQMFGKPVGAAASQPLQVTPTPQQATAPPVLGQDVKKVEPVVASPSTASFLPQFSYPQILAAFIVFLMASLAIDFYVVNKLQIVRLHGKNTAHMIFLIIMASGAVILLTRGGIM